MTLPTSPKEVAEVIRERAGALNVVLAYAYTLHLEVDIRLVLDENEDTDDENELVNIVSIQQVFDL